VESLFTGVSVLVCVFVAKHVRTR